MDYAANQGIEWVVLTNGWNWQIFKVQFSQPIDKTKVFDIDILQMTPRSDALLDCFGNLSKEGFTLSSMAALFQQRQATSKYSLACILQSDAVVATVRRELRRLFPRLKVDEEALRTDTRVPTSASKAIPSRGGPIASPRLIRCSHYSREPIFRRWVGW